MLPRAERLTRRRDFGAVYRRGRRYEHPLLTLYLRPSGGEQPRRFGFSVSKKVGKAHDRNRIKRRLREICRALPTQPGRDFVLVARAGASEAETALLREALVQLFSRAGVLTGGGDA
jgi:ribonuclease P protein component